MVLRILPLIFLFILSLGLTPSFAEEKATEPVKVKTEILQGKVSDLMKTLDMAQARHFMTMYANYNIYSMVKAVREDVHQAVEACADNNKNMADKVRNKFSRWDDSVGGTMKEADANIQNLALAQTYLPQSELKSIFSLVDEVRAVNSSRFEKTPVTTPEACEFMISKMDETETSMNSLLQATLISYPNMLQKTQE